MPLDRDLAGHAIHVSLSDERAQFAERSAGSGSRRNAKTLVKEGPLRLTLMEVAAGGEIPPHHAEGPICVHVLEGGIRCRAGETEWTLGAGELLTLPAAVEHSVTSEGGGVFLLTVVLEGK